MLMPPQSGGMEIKMTADLTTGSPFKQILKFSIPYLIGNLFQQFYNIADMVIVGRTIDPLAYAAVGATGSLVWFASGAIQALTTGFSVITARHFGAGDKERVKQSFAAGIKLSAYISIALALICTLFARQILEIMQTPSDLIDRSYKYIVWIFAGLVATAFYNLLSNVIRALGDSKTPLLFLVAACIINIILDFVFIVYFGMDTDGAGLATVLAQLISGLLCVVYIKKKLPLLYMSSLHFKHSGGQNKLLLSVGIPMAFLNIVLSIGSIIMQFVTNGLGTLYVSSQTTGSKLEQFVTQPILSFGSASAVYAAQNYGAKKYKRVIDGGRRALLLCFIWCALATVIMFPLGRPLVRLLAGNVESAIVDNAYFYILVNTALCVFVSPLVIYKSILQALGRNICCTVSGFTEIVGRAGISVTVISLIRSAVIGEQTGYYIMCFASPAAWVLGFLTVLVDYIMLIRRLSRLEGELSAGTSVPLSPM